MLASEARARRGAADLLPGVAAESVADRGEGGLQRLAAICEGFVERALAVLFAGQMSDRFDDVLIERLEVGEIRLGPGLDDGADVRAIA